VAVGTQLVEGQAWTSVPESLVAQRLLWVTGLEFTAAKYAALRRAVLLRARLKCHPEVVH